MLTGHADVVNESDIAPNDVPEEFVAYARE